jgi:hypothetical protein
MAVGSRPLPAAIDLLPAMRAGHWPSGAAQIQKHFIPNGPLRFL